MVSATLDYPIIYNDSAAGDVILPVSRPVESTRISSAILYHAFGPLPQAQIAFDELVAPVMRSKPMFKSNSTIFCAISDNAGARHCSVQRDRIFAAQGALQIGYDSGLTSLRLQRNDKDPVAPTEIPKPNYADSFHEIKDRSAAYIVGKQKELE